MATKYRIKLAYVSDVYNEPRYVIQKRFLCFWKRITRPYANFPFDVAGKMLQQLNDNNEKINS